MPIFEYVCTSCGHEFEAIVRRSQKAICPKCEGTRLKQKFSVFAVASGGGSNSSEALSDDAGCGTCGDPDGPCSLDD